MKRAAVDDSHGDREESLRRGKNNRIGSSDHDDAEVMDQANKFRDTALTRNNEAKTTFPNPKNFAERLMSRMQRETRSQCLQWTSDGQAIALHTQNIKNDTEFLQHFKVTKYGGFIRNCNRWGFKRVPYPDASFGDVFYRCSLFRRNEPHLVKHMRIDSDVQDVFERHQSQAASASSSRHTQVARRPPPPATAQAQGTTHEQTLQEELSAVVSNNLFLRELQQSENCPKTTTPTASQLRFQRSKTILARILELGGKYVQQASPVSDENERAIRSVLYALGVMGQQCTQDIPTTQELNRLDTSGPTEAPVTIQCNIVRSPVPGQSLLQIPSSGGSFLRNAHTSLMGTEAHTERQSASVPSRPGASDLSQQEYLADLLERLTHDKRSVRR